MELIERLVCAIKRIDLFSAFVGWVIGSVVACIASKDFRAAVEAEKKAEREGEDTP